MGLKILGRVGTHIFLNYIFFWKKIYNFMHFERHLAFQNAYIYIFSENQKKNLVFMSKFR